MNNIQQIASEYLTCTRPDIGEKERASEGKCPSSDGATYWEDTNKDNHSGCYSQSDEGNKQGLGKRGHRRHFLETEPSGRASPEVVFRLRRER